MYEFDVDHEIASYDSIPQAIIGDFVSSRLWIDALAIIPWEEHCTECAMPQCFTSCDLYESRKDGKCRRFVGGSIPVIGIPNLLGYVTKIRFKPWGQLLAYSNLHLVSAALAEKVFKSSLKLDNIIARVPDYGLNILGRRGISSRLMRRFKLYITTGGVFAEAQEQIPDFLLLEVYNPQDSVVSLTLIVRDVDGPLKDLPFQKLIEVQPGFNRELIPFQEVAPHIARERVFHIALCPNINDPLAQGPTLYFGLLTFVKQRTRTTQKQTSHEPKKLKHVKVLIWDLDNTLWRGILIEDGGESIVLREGVADVIKELDRRGIVNSIASKNNADDAKRVLQKLGVLEYFVYPKFSWAPKSQSIEEIIEAFNIGEDTIAFIDDSPFEREEVSRVFLNIRVFDATESSNLLGLPDFCPPESEESYQRRYYYQNEEKRQNNRVAFVGDYPRFLRDCCIKMKISNATEHNVDRVNELIQRTNQLNFSGKSYTRGQVAQLLKSGFYDAYCIHCDDRFGHYGLVGFCSVNRHLGRVVDLMFSCRVQSKQVEHAFLRALLGKQKSTGLQRLEVVYRPSARNSELGKVFTDLGFQLASSNQDSSEQVFSFDLCNEVSAEAIVDVRWSNDAGN